MTEQISGNGFRYPYVIVSTTAVLHGTDYEYKNAADVDLVPESLLGAYHDDICPGDRRILAFAIPVLGASTAYTVAEVFSSLESLSAHFREVKGFYSMLGASVLFPVTLRNLAPIRITPFCIFR